MSASFRSRLAGLLLMGGLGLLLIINLRWVCGNWRQLRESGYAGVDEPRCALRPALCAGAHAGRPAPDFRLPLITGGSVALGEAHGHALVLSFWATWCEPCQRELPGLERLYQRLRSLGVQFVAVNTEGPRARAAVVERVKRLGLTMPVALDDGVVADLYGVDSIPQTILIDDEGQVRGVYTGLYNEHELEGVIRSIVK